MVLSFAQQRIRLERRITCGEKGADINDAMVALKKLAELDTGSQEGCLTEESFDIDSENGTDCSDKWTHATDDECIEKEIFEVKALDNLIRRMNGQVKVNIFYVMLLEQLFARHTRARIYTHVPCKSYRRKQEKKHRFLNGRIEKG